MECSFSMVCLLYYAYSRLVNVLRNILVASRLGSYSATKRPRSQPLAVPGDRHPADETFGRDN